MTTNALNSSFPPRRHLAADYAITRNAAVRIILTAMLYLALWRATGMWYGYPSVFDEAIEVDPTPMKIVLYSLIPLCGMYALLEPRRLVSFFRSTPKLIIVLGAICVLSIFVSVDVGASIRGLAALSVLTVGSLLFRMRYGSVETYRVISNFLMGAAFLNVAYTIVFPHFAVMGGSYAGMVKGAFYHKNGLGQFASVALVILFSTRRRGPGITYREVVQWAAMACFLALIVATRSSTSVVMAVIGISIAAALQGVQKVPSKFFRTYLVLTAIAFLTIGGSLAYLGVAQMIADAFDKDLTFSGRTNIWEQLIPLIYDRPLLGYGFAVFKQPEIMYHYVQVTFDAKSTHNTYLEVALNTGVIGLLSWLAFVLMRIVSKSTMRPRTASEGAIVATEVAILCIMLVGAMMEAGTFLAPSIIWPYVAIALCSYVSLRGDSRPRSMPG